MDNTSTYDKELFIARDMEFVGRLLDDVKIPPHTRELVSPCIADTIQPLLIPHDYRNIEIADGTTITLDVEELKEQMKRDFYKQEGLSIQFGA